MGVQSLLVLTLEQLDHALEVVDHLVLQVDRLVELVILFDLLVEVSDSGEQSCILCL